MATFLQLVRTDCFVMIRTAINGQSWLSIKIWSILANYSCTNREICCMQPMNMDIYTNMMLGKKSGLWLVLSHGFMGCAMCMTATKLCSNLHFQIGRNDGSQIVSTIEHFGLTYTLHQDGTFKSEIPENVESLTELSKIEDARFPKSSFVSLYVNTNWCVKENNNT